MTDTIQDQLRREDLFYPETSPYYQNEVANRAADEIDRLRVKVERLRGALEDIAKIDYTTAATTGACHKAVTIASRALGEVEDD